MAARLLLVHSPLVGSQTCPARFLRGYRSGCMLVQRMGLYAAYTWTAQPGLNTLQAVRFYVPASGAIALLGAWLVTHTASRGALAMVTTAAVTAALFTLGLWSYNDMRPSMSGRLDVVGPGPPGAPRRPVEGAVAGAVAGAPAGRGLT